MEVISPKETAKKGLKKYFTGNPCKNGHIAERLISTRCCLKCAANRAKVWEAKNKEFRKTQKAEYYLFNKEHITARNSIYVLNNKQKRADWYKEYREANKHKLATQSQEWAKNNPAKATIKSRRHQLAKIQRIPKWLTKVDLFEIECIYTYAAALNRVGLVYHVDHIIPLQGKIVSGLHVPENLRVIPAKENISKRNKFEPNQEQL